MFRNGHLGRPCPTCGRDLGEVETPVFMEKGIESIPYCSISCKSAGMSAPSQSTSTSLPEKSEAERLREEKEDERWARWARTAYD